MAHETLPDRARQPKSRYYDPPAAIATVAGVSVRRTNDRSDSYIGTADALVATGLLSHAQFPGQPGLPPSKVTYRPRGVEGPCYFMPGYMEVFRKLDSVFQIVLTVSDEEQARRRAERHARDEAQYARIDEAVAHRNRVDESRKDELDMLTNLHAMPKSHVTVRESAIEAFRSSAASFVSFHMQARDSHGYRYSADAIDDFATGLQDLVELLSDGETLYNESRQRAAVSALVGDSARKDVALRRLLGSSMRP